ncbi:hypothetical protein [Sporisorium scitamineum]|uniref:N-acetyltransferase domain-containing protein n=1 Tax=Sporisorium scitamineum TaxID=49012 RepID=A0A0F7S2Q8_9BASI|nr:hypothetical protein [Sporisorium scitamineum]
MTPSTPTRTSPRKGAASAARAVSTAPPAIKAEVEDVELPPTPSSVGDSPAQGKRKRGSVKNETSEIGDLLSTPAKLEEVDDKNGITSAPTSPSKKQTTSERKLASYKTSILGSPFPDHPLPTPHEAERVAWILGEFHGYKRESAGGRGLPKYTTPKDQDTWGGCGNVPSVLDALIRTVLSCNTSNRNSAAAHRSLTEHFGRANWSAIHAAPEHELVQAIRCGGLANNKARTIKGILAQTHQKYGKLSLDHLHDATDDEIMQELKNGLLGRKGKALRDAAAATAANAAVESSSSGNRSDVKVEKQEPTDFNTDSAASPSKKPKPNQIGYAAALQTALASTSTDLLHLLQHSRSTRSSNPISPHLKTRHYSLELLHASQLSSEQRKRIFHLFERNMKTLYRNSTLGWKPTLKKRELFDPSSRFAIVRPPPEEGAEIAAFAMFRFDTEPCHPSDPTARQGEQAVEVVYLYEIQVRRESQRDGLGRELMDVVWQLGKRVGMRKVMLTVFDENRGARRFYERMGYGVDPASPSLDDEVKGRVDFVTMFKRL